MKITVIGHRSWRRTGNPPARDSKRNTHRILTKKSRPVKAGSSREERRRSFARGLEGIQGHKAGPGHPEALGSNVSLPPGLKSIEK